MEEKKELSFTAASTWFPIKILLNPEVYENIEKHGKIIPVHIQLNPTNRCNLNCPFCSCSDRDKSIEMSYEEIMDIMMKFKIHGAKSVTITGGGEPLMHPEINEIIQNIKKYLGIEVGLVTNGLLLDRLTKESLDCITWIRISLGDHRTWDENFEGILDRAVEKGPNVDWSFSYVIGFEPNYELIEKMVLYANKKNFTHIRLVTDIFIEDQKMLEVMESVKKYLKDKGIDDSLVIYQERVSYTKGTKRCLISLLKPVVGADGNLYACCGIQYAFKGSKRDYVMTMGKALESIDEIWCEDNVEKEKYFDGSKCDKCYYQHYNELLDILTSGIKHKEFV